MRLFESHGNALLGDIKEDFNFDEEYSYEYTSKQYKNYINDIIMQLNEMDLSHDERCLYLLAAVRDGNVYVEKYDLLDSLDSIKEYYKWGDFADNFEFSEELHKVAKDVESWNKIKFANTMRKVKNSIKKEDE